MDRSSRMSPRFSSLLVLLVSLAVLCEGGVGGEPPVSVSAPSVVGVPQLELAVQCDVGSWTSSLALTFGFQWQRCDGAGAACVDLRAATGPSFEPFFGELLPG